MPVKERELYSSSNGDCWHLVREPRSERLFIRHTPNLASGGDTSGEIPQMRRDGIC
jgi:hypothetical protein